MGHVVFRFNSTPSPMLMDEQSHQSRSELIGLTLHQAREVLQIQSQFSALPLRIVETAPPPKPLPSEKPVGAKKRPQNEPQVQRIRQWGEWRVLRCRLCTNDVELLVAREELRPQEVAIEAAASEATATSFSPSSVQLL